MPLYEFENDEHGVTVMLWIPVEKRPGEIVLRRKQIPSNLTVGVGAKPPTMSDKLRDGYRRLEEKGKMNDNGKHFDKATVKKALEMPEVD